jgi:hypothetical protein
LTGLTSRSAFPAFGDVSQGIQIERLRAGDCNWIALPVGPRLGLAHSHHNIARIDGRTTTYPRNALDWTERLSPTWNTATSSEGLPPQGFESLFRN